MLDWDSQKNFIVYPSWAKFSYHWADLIGLFVKSAEQWEAFGYRLEPHDYDLRDGAFGGVIEKRGPLEYWSPLKVLYFEAMWGPIFRLSRSEKWWVSVLIPKTSDANRSGIKPVPSAPSPSFSVELIGHLNEYAYVALGSSPRKKSPFKPDHFVAGLRHFGVKCAVYVGDPVISPEDASIICPGGLKWHWIQITPEQWCANALLAFIVYLGMHFATPPASALVRVHLLSAFKEFPQRYGSCRTWPTKISTAKTADDW